MIMKKESEARIFWTVNRMQELLNEYDGGHFS
jgi:hypothetical protein